MGYSRSEIISGVRKELDEIQLNDAGFAVGTDDTDLDELIIHLLSEAVEFCYEHADLSMLSPTSVKTGSDVESKQISSYTDGPFFDSTYAYIKNAPSSAAGYVGVCSLPSSFLRLHRASVSTWERDVTVATYWNDEGASKLKNWYTTGSAERPVVYITKDSEGYTAYLYILEGGDDINLAIIEKPSMAPGQQGGYDIDSKLYGAILTYTAGLVLVTLKDQHADALLNKALVRMGAQTSKDNG